jgi:hypothetical protein
VATDSGGATEYIERLSDEELCSDQVGLWVAEKQELTGAISVDDDMWSQSGCDEGRKMKRGRPREGETEGSVDVGTNRFQPKRKTS